MEKILTFAVPCYNSAAYMDHCIETLLTGGEDIEIILVDDGSTKDDTSSGPSTSKTGATERV